MVNQGKVGAIALNTLVKGAGYPILCLHGHPGRGQSMSIFTDYLANRFQTIAPDLRGYGRSQVQASFTMTDHLLDLQTLLDRRQIQRCLVLGWSLGGILAIELALQMPHRVSGLILVATAARPWGTHPPISWQDNALTGIAGTLNWLKPGWQWNIEQFGQRSLFRYLVQQHTPATYQFLASEAVPAYLQTSRQATQALYTAMGRGYNRLPDLPNIQCPCLVLAGEGDRHISPIASEETARHLTHSEWRCYPQTAHLFPWEIPHQVVTDIDQWLSQYPQVVAADR
jgi:proline iminopeptidase